MNKFVEKFLGILFPEGVTCDRCKRELTDEDDREVELCRQCAASLVPVDDAKVVVDFVTTYALYKYSSVRWMILDLKENDKTYLAKHIAVTLYRFYKENGLHANLIAYVPSGKKNKRRRGYDHMQFIAEEFSACSGLPICEDLVHTREVADQTEIEAGDRFKNVEGSFGYRGLPLYGKSVLLLDDVMTTGATLTACVRVLRAACPDSIECLTLARVEK